MKRPSSRWWRGPRPRSPSSAAELPIEALFDRIAALPPVGIYLAIAAIAAIENVFPPVPADTAAALGGFLAARNPHLNVWIVWLVTVVANTGSAAAVYLAARRVGKDFLASRIGRRLMSPELVTRVQVEFEQHQVWGIFVSRCLPVYRAVVPALSGIMNIPARRAIPAIATASALFYGLVIWLAYTVGQNWAAVAGLIGRLGTGLAVAALAVTAALVWFFMRRRRARARD